jgi:cytochrome c biogenesis protein CcmG/thiol:disulfide interchange protein DsbE
MTNSIIETKTEAPPRLRWSSILLWAVVIGLLALVGWGLLNNSKPRPEAGQNAPDFDLAFYNGYEWQNLDQASLAEMRGHVIVLNFWASWCTPCRMEADLLQSAWQKYSDQGVIFLGVAWADSKPKSLAFLEEFNITYPTGPDLRSAISANYEITGVPETFFIDKEGNIAYVHIVPLDDATLENNIEQLLNTDS